MKKMMSYFLVLGLSLFVASCDKDDDTPDPNVSFSATLNGASEETPTGSAATGTATGIYNTNTKILTLTITYSGFTTAVTAGHVHGPAAVGVSAPPVLPAFSSLASPISFTSPELTAQQETDLMAGRYYVNLHTTAFPGGEIRGQLVKN